MVMGSKDLLSCTEYRILSLEVSVSLLSADGIWQDSQRIRVDDDDCPFLFVCVVNSVGCASFGQTIVDGKDKIRMVDQPAVTTEHTVSCVMAAYIDGFIALSQNIEIAVSLFHTPAVSLTLTWQRRYEPNTLLWILLFAGKDDLRAPNVCTQCHPRKKCCHAIFNQRHDLNCHQLF